MEKLCIRLLIFLSCLQVLHAQESLCVFTVSGNAKVGNTFLSKGDLITAKDKVTLFSESKLVVFDSKGDAYQMVKSGKHTYKTILKNNKLKQKNNITVNYLKYLWKEFSNSGKKETIIAGVFRGDVLMESPKNNSIITHDQITFKWKSIDNTIDYYFYIKNIETQELIKIQTDGTELTVYDEFPLFKGGVAFEWAVVKEAFPNVKNIPFFSFKKLNYDEYELLKSTYNEFILDLENMGYEEITIKDILCEKYNLCD